MTFQVSFLARRKGKRGLNEGWRRERPVWMERKLLVEIDFKGSTYDKIEGHYERTK